MPMRRRARRSSRAAEPGDLGVVERDGAGGRLDQPVDAADDGRFAGARGADQRHHLAVRHVEIDALEREIAGAIALGQPLDTQHAAPPSGEFYLQLYFTPLAASILRITLQSFL